MTEIQGFLEELSSSQPVPGGGSVAALQAALAAGLLVMVGNLTLGKKKYAAVQGRVEELRGQATKLRDAAYRLIEEDARAYGRVHEAMKLPKETEEEAAVRREGIQEALKAAAIPPLETMRVAVDIVNLALPLSEIGNRSAVSDVGVSALSAGAAFHGAKLNVQINLESVRDEDWVEKARTEMNELTAPDAEVESVMRRVAAIIAGEQS